MERGSSRRMGLFTKALVMIGSLGLIMKSKKPEVEPIVPTILRNYGHIGAPIFNGACQRKKRTNKLHCSRRARIKHRARIKIRHRDR